MPGTPGGRAHNVEVEVSVDAHTTNHGAGSYLGPGRLPAEWHGQPQADMYAAAGAGIVRL